MQPESLILVVPCRNEAARLDPAAFLRALEERPGLRFVFVDDASTDRTAERLEELRRGREERVRVLTLERHLGKGEAVRRGMLEALSAGPLVVGYWDADLSTPLEELEVLLEALTAPDVAAAIGCRLKLLGRTVERRALRHYLGRVYATFASMALDLAVYDTQCGAKLFRASAENEALFTRPFISRWLFDVEILARMIEQSRRSPERHPLRAVREVPLGVWRDVPGSKVKLLDGLRALVDLVRIRRLRGGAGRQT